MIESPRILVVDPHPDDESFFWGGTIAKYAKQGAEIYLLVLSNGEKGKISITHSEKGFQGFREAETLKDQEWLAAERQKECKEAVNFLGIKHVEFLGIPNLEVDQSAIVPIKTVIKNFDPHVVFSFNEAGTFSPANQDHSWAGIATFMAIKSILIDCLGGKISPEEELNLPLPISFRRYLTYTLPAAGQLLEQWAEMNLNRNELTSINISDEIGVKRQACSAHKTQSHLTKFFSQIGILDIREELFYERINIGSSSKGKNDLLYGIEQFGMRLSIPKFPEEKPRYASSTPNFYNIIYQRCTSFK